MILWLRQGMFELQGMALPWFAVLLVVGAFAGCPSAVSTAEAASSPKTVKIGILAKRGTNKALERWNATAAYLSEAVPGAPFEIVPMEFDEIPVLVSNRLVDFVIVNPGIYVQLSVDFGVQRILTLKNSLSPGVHVTQFGSVMFTRQGAGLPASLQDVKGAKVAAVHPTSLGGWIMALHALREAGVEEGDFAALKFLETHDAVVLSVLKGESDVGIVRTDTLERMAEEGLIDLNALRVINNQTHPSFPFKVSTPLYPEWPFAKVAHTSDDLAKDVAGALMRLKPGMPATDDADILGWTIPQSYEPVRDLLRDMRLPPYDRFDPISIARVVAEYWPWLVVIAVLFAAQTVQLARNAALNRRLADQQEAIRISEARFRGTFEQAAFGIAHATVGGRIIRANYRYSQITGYSEAELKKMSFSELTHPQDASLELTRLDGLRKGKTGSFSLQKRHACKGGGYVWVLSSVSLMESDGEEKHLVVAIGDIGRLKDLENTIYTEQQLRDIILDNAGEGILGVDQFGVHTFVNPAAADMLGWSVEEMLGKDSHSMWHHTLPDGTEFPASQCPITSVLRQGVQHRGYDELFWRKDGSSFKAQYVSTPMLKDGRAVGAVIVFHSVEGGRS
ncbi:MAG: PhnD/SsuA/transferrin family substrate-binding protein [Alphaproteobacteria bacterium]|nr:PhnD/SsuA/transferrin family substrate-binding protein [Alphaproteobacteria bacterium]MBF0249610.1 PhnD/SsuA/transferrin family substrate-binding protein [Alphaproteobacteria bacterium]